MWCTWSDVFIPYTVGARRSRASLYIGNVGVLGLSDSLYIGNVGAATQVHLSLPLKMSVNFGTTTGLYIEERRCIMVYPKSLCLETSVSPESCRVFISRNVGVMT